MKTFMLILMPLCFVVSPLAGETNQGHFIRFAWFQKGIEHGNPMFNSRIRVNAPEASLHPSFMYRSEVRGNGMIQILLQEDLAYVESGELYGEIWGGHPGTANKRVIVNGRSTYLLPEVGTENHNCTYFYPKIPLKVTDLVNGYNVFQFACDQGTTFWGHFLIDNACLRVQWKKDHPRLKESGLDSCTAQVQAKRTTEETIELKAKIDDNYFDRIDRVNFYGRYYGYDENGNTKFDDWHGFTKNKEPVAILGTANNPPYRIAWNTSMIPDQDHVSFKARIYFKEQNNIFFETSTIRFDTFNQRENIQVRLIQAEKIPKPFWSRDNRVKECVLPLNVDPSKIERAQLHVVIWDGGQGNIQNPFTFNDHPLPVAGEGHHDVSYRVIELQPEQILKGENRIRLLSDTKHHGIEVLLPGPALIIRESMN